MPDRKIKIATMSVFGYPDIINAGKYLFTHEQAKALAGICEVHAFDLGADETLYNKITEEIYDNIKVFRFPKILRTSSDVIKKLFRLLSYRRKLKRMLSDYDYLLLSFIDPRYVLLLFPFRNIKVAITAHGYDALVNLDNFLIRPVKKLLLHKVNLIFPVSYFTSDLVRNSISKADQSKIRVVYNGINKTKLLPAENLDKEEFKKSLGITNKKVILTICNLIERKGVDIAIKADKILKERGYDFVHIIVGKGREKKKLDNLIKELNIGGNIYFMEKLSDQQIGSYYKMADVFVVISRSLLKQKQVEGFGIVFAEAGFLGIPVVAGNSGGVPGVVKHEYTGFLINPETEEPEKITADYIQKIFSDHELWYNLSENSKKYVRSNFDWDLNAQRVIDLFQEDAKGI